MRFMEYRKGKNMNLLFSKVIEHNVLPKKYTLHIIMATFIVLLLLYVAASILYICALIKYNTLSFGSIIISIIEIIIVVFSIIMSFIATYISNYINNSCIKLIENINRHNEPMFKDIEQSRFSTDIKKYSPLINWIKIVFFIIVLIYCIVSTSYYLFIDSAAIQILTSILSSISTILTIILALVSSLSCFVTGKYTQFILNNLDRHSTLLANKYNKIKIEQSHSKSTKT